MCSETGKYVDYNIEGVSYDPARNYNGLVNVLVSQLTIGITINKLQIKFLANDKSPPMSIHNDMGVHVYMDQERVNVDFFK